MNPFSSCLDILSPSLKAGQVDLANRIASAPPGSPFSIYIHYNSHFDIFLNLIKAVDAIFILFLWSFSISCASNAGLEPRLSYRAVMQKDSEDKTRHFQYNAVSFRAESLISINIC